MYDITVGTVVNVNVHSMMLFYLHTAGETETQSQSRFTVTTRDFINEMLDKKKLSTRSDHTVKVGGDR